MIPAAKPLIGDEEREAEFLPRGRDTDHQLLDETRMNEARDERLLAAPRPEEKDREHGHEHREEPENFWMRKRHGNFRQSVWARRISSNRTASPAATNARNNSE